MRLPLRAQERENSESRETAVVIIGARSNGVYLG
jgi:hypothetical protein